MGIETKKKEKKTKSNLLKAGAALASLVIAILFGNKRE